MIDVLVVGGIYREVLDGDSTPRFRFGGSGLTAAIVAARSGVRTGLTSFVGEEDADSVFAMLQAADVDVRGVSILPGASGTFVFPTDGTRPWPMYRPAEALPDNAPQVSEAGVYVVFGMPDCDPVALGWLEHLQELAILIWDRQGWISRARNAQAVGELSPQHKIYVANRDEAIAEFSAQAWSELLDKLPPPKYQGAVIKRGKDGCTVVDEKEATDIRGFPLEVASTVGSGDAFAGAFAAGLARGANIRQAALQGNAMASAFLIAAGDALNERLSENAQALLRE